MVQSHCGKPNMSDIIPAIQTQRLIINTNYTSRQPEAQS